jgi:hypothetical protein
MKRQLLPILLLLPIIAFGQEADYESYDECILDRLAGISSDLAAQALIKACENKFDSEDISDIPKIAVSTDKSSTTSIDAEGVIQREEVKEVEENNIYNFKTIMEEHSDYVYRAPRAKILDNLSFSLLISSFNIRHTNPTNYEAFNSSDVPFNDYHENVSTFENSVFSTTIRDISEWAFLNDYDMSGEISTNDLGDSISLELDNIAVSIKQGQGIRRWDYQLSEDSIDKLSAIPSDYVLVMHIDHINFEKWLFKNEPNYSSYYENPQPLPPTTTAGTVVGLAANILLGPVAGIVGEIGTNLTNRINYNNTVNFNHLNHLSAYLISTKDPKAIIWGVNVMYMSQLSPYSQIVPSYILEEYKPFQK